MLSVMQINEELLMIKWNVKNRFKVGLLIENPPQIHNTIASSIIRNCW